MGDVTRYCFGPQGMIPAQDTPCPEWDTDEQWVKATDYDALRRVAERAYELLKAEYNYRGGAYCDLQAISKWLAEADAVLGQV